MSQLTSKTPIAYLTSVERPESDEAEAIKGLEDAIHEIQATTAKDYGSAIRGVHAKGHGLLDARVTVLDSLPPELAQGLFGEPGTYSAIMRFSTAPGDILDDSVSSPRGLAIKILEVPGERLPGAEAGHCQDFLLVNGPAFGNATAAKFLPGLKLLAKTTDRVDGLKQTLSAVLQTVEGALETVGLKSSLVSSLGGAPNTVTLSVLGSRPFFSAALCRRAIDSAASNPLRVRGNQPSQ